LSGHGLSSSSDFPGRLADRRLAALISTAGSAPASGRCSNEGEKHEAPDTLHLAQQHRSAWTHEIDLRAFSDRAWNH
jgi:hypothetical protein